MKRLGIKTKALPAPRELITDIYLITLLFLFPLFPGFSGYEKITLSKFVFLLVVTGLWLAALLVLALTKADNAPLPRLTAPQWAAFAFLAAALLSSLASPWYPATLLGTGRYDGLISLAVYVMIFLGASVFTRPKPVHAAALAVSAALCCAVGILQLLGCDPLRLYPAGVGWADAGTRYVGAYLGTVGNTNILDAILCLAIPLCAVSVLRRRKWVYLLPLALSLAVVAAAGGSGAAVALCAFVPAALLVLPRSRRSRRVCAVIAAALCLASLAALWFWPGTDGTLYEISQTLHGHPEDSFGSSRIRIWRECFALFPERPLLGGGPGTLRQRVDIVFSRFIPETGITARTAVDNAHSIYLGYLINTGLLGLAAYLALLISSALRALRLSRSDDLIAAIALAVFCGAVHACFGLGLSLSEPLFFALLGLCCPLQLSELPEGESCL